MTVFAVCVYRIDTTKEHDKVVSLYSDETRAKEHKDNLNSVFEKDKYEVRRARVEPMEVR